MVQMDYWASPVSWTLYGLFATQFGDIQDRTGQLKQFNNFFTNYFGFRHDFVGIVAVVVGLQ